MATTRVDLAGSAARGAAQSMAAQVVRLVTQILGIIILARMLDPSDFGILAVLVAVVGIGELARDFGLTNAVLQARQVSRRQRDTLFWISTTLGLAFAVLCMGLAPLLASAYDQPNLTVALVAVAPTFFLNGASAQHRAGLLREMRFLAVAVADTLAPVLGLAVACVGATIGWGYMALVAQQLVTAAASCLCVVYLARWRPGRPVRLSRVRGFINYGANLLGAQVVTYIGRASDSLVGGLQLSSGQLGLYNRASTIISVPLSQITPVATRVAVPVLARLQDESDSYNAYLVRGQLILLHGLLMPLTIAGALAHPLTAIILGPDWVAAGAALQILALGAVFRVATYSTYWVALSRALTQVSLRIAMIAAPVAVLASWLGSRGGIIGLAIGVVAASAFTWVVSLAMYARYARAVVAALVRGVLPTATVYGLAGVCGAFTWSALQASTSSTAASIALTCGSYLAIVCCGLAWPAFRGGVMSSFSTVRLLKRADTSLPEVE